MLTDTRALQPGDWFLALRGERSGPGGDAIDIKLYGNSTENLKAAAESLKQSLAPMEGVSALEDTLAYDKPELNLTLTPRGEWKRASTQEELVAEMGSAFLNAQLGVGLEGMQHPSYIDHYLQVLRSDKRALMRAATAARKASEFLLQATAEVQAV